MDGRKEKRRADVALLLPARLPLDTHSRGEWEYDVFITVRLQSPVYGCVCAVGRGELVSPVQVCERTGVS